MTKPSEEAEATAGATKETDVAAKGIKPAKLTAIIIAAVVVALAGIGGGYAYWTHHEGNAYHEAVAPSGNVQLILDIFNKTGVPAYVSRLCSGGAYCRYATTWPWTWYSSSRLWPAWPRAADGRRR